MFRRSVGSVCFRRVNLRLWPLLRRPSAAQGAGGGFAPAPGVSWLDSVTLSGVSGSRSVSGSVLLSSASVELCAVVSLMRGFCPLLVARLPLSITLATPLWEESVGGSVFSLPLWGFGFFALIAFCRFLSRGSPSHLPLGNLSMDGLCRRFRLLVPRLSRRVCVLVRMIPGVLVPPGLCFVGLPFLIL